ncbi:MAG: nucleotidyltransferase domain-containing protein [Candidatus Nanoarchaeia archaeon]|nr:nucleotidyltransferase domain-containing protein [Candidatus Nanoarchaeia archaeon]
MLGNYNKYKLLKVFFLNPTDSLRLREISRMANLSPPSVMQYLKEFEKQGLVKKYIKRNIPFYQAQRDNEDFKAYSRIGIIFELHDSGLIEHIWEKLAPEAIILFGSCAKGECIEESDIDLFIIGKEKKLDLKAFEKRMGRNIHLLFEENPKNISKELINNLINGIVLKGYLKVN